MRFRDLLKVTKPKTYCVVTVDGEQFEDDAYRFEWHHENILDYMVVSVSASFCRLNIHLKKEA